MTGPPSDPPEPPDAGAARRSGRGRLAWRVGTPVMVLLCGGLFAVSAANSQGTDLRPGRYADLASLVQTESDDYESLKARADELDAEVKGLTEGVVDEGVRRRQRLIDKLRAPAGLEPSAGVGVTVVLSDAPRDVVEEAITNPEIDLNRLVVHQQDIQAVVNAMWLGGARAVTIQGQRVVTTTGIKCRGNAVQLDGQPYPQPYVIQAVGDPTALFEAMDSDYDIGKFRDDAARPDIAVGWDAESEDLVEAPAYDGLLDINYAKPSAKASS